MEFGNAFGLGLALISIRPHFRPVLLNLSLALLAFGLTLSLALGVSIVGPERNRQRFHNGSFTSPCDQRGVGLRFRRFRLGELGPPTGAEPPCPGDCRRIELGVLGQGRVHAATVSRAGRFEPAMSRA